MATMSNAVDFFPKKRREEEGRGRWATNLEEHDVAVDDGVVLALLSVLAGGLNGGFAAVLLEVGVGHHLRADESVHEVRVDHSGSLRRLGTLLHAFTHARHTHTHTSDHKIVTTFSQKQKRSNEVEHREEAEVRTLMVQHLTSSAPQVKK